jgi:N-acetylglucosaminyldiphosphoundecaprenol N-acetyl-beta-D-mannosaminyltransferase
MTTVRAPEDDVPRCAVLGIPFYAGGFEEAVQMVVRRARSGEGGYATLTSVHGLTLAQRVGDVRRALDAAWLNLPDGVPVTWLEHRRGARQAERVCGIDLLPRVVDVGRETRLRHYFFGSSREALDALERRLTATYPRSMLVGSCAPPFGPIDDHSERGLIADITAASPDIVWIGLGAPKQEMWMRRFGDELRPALVLGVGAAFDIVAGLKPRAPEWMQRNGLEWLYRFACEPRRLARRYMLVNGEFLARAAADEVRRRAGRAKPV